MTTPAAVRPCVLAAFVGAVLLAAHPAAAAVSDRQARTFILEPGRALDVEVTIGEVRISGWDGPEVALEVTRQAPTVEALATIPLVVDEAAPARVRVAVVQPDGGTSPALRATVVLRVPRRAVIDAVRVLEGKVAVEGFEGTLTADVRRGDVEGVAVAGALRLETGIGSVVLKRARLSPGGLLRLRAFNGDVRLHLAAVPADARVLALALNGTISSTVPLAMKSAWGPRFGEATLGRGAPVISIDVVTGTVEITTG